MLRPYRSVLYIPASKLRALEKARDLPADAIILDLEDAVAAEEKPAARANLAATLADTSYGHRACLVRVNGLDTEWGAADVAAFAGVGGCDAIVIPKVNSPADLDAVAAMAPAKPLWAMMETAAGILNAAAIAAHPALRGMVMGTNDLARELGARHRPDRLPLQAGLGWCLLAARAQGRVIIDGVYNAFRDDAGLLNECEQGRDMGFDGKTLIHPAQLATANAVFGPSKAEVALAHRQIEAFEAITQRGQGVAVVDGSIVENLHVVSARATLAMAQAIAEMAD